METRFCGPRDRVWCDICRGPLSCTLRRRTAHDSRDEFTEALERLLFCISAAQDSRNTLHAYVSSKCRVAWCRNLRFRLLRLRQVFLPRITPCLVKQPIGKSSQAVKNAVDHSQVIEIHHFHVRNIFYLESICQNAYCDTFMTPTPLRIAQSVSPEPSIISPIVSSRKSKEQPPHLPTCCDTSKR
jgi:hypothetical protein